MKSKRKTMLQRKCARLRADGNALPRWEHVEDRKVRLDSIAMATRLGPAFVREHAAELAAVITTYNDMMAEDILGLLREHFWSGDWERRRQQRRPAARRQSKAGEP